MTSNPNDRDPSKNIMFHDLLKLERRCITLKVESELKLEKVTKNNLVYEAKKDTDPIGMLYVKKKSLESRPLTIKVSIDMN